MIKTMKKKLALSLPQIAECYRILRYGFTPPTFSGWGMTILSNPPWVNSFPDCQLENVQGFEEANNDMLLQVQKNNFVLSQIAKVDNKIEFLNGLKYRHYIVYWSALYAAKHTTSNLCAQNLVECGVCDGLTVFYAMRAVKSLGKEFSSYLYDAWDGMKAEYLLESEMSSSGEYSYLQMDNTIRNLEEFSHNVVFNKGYIPDSFAKSNNPSDLIWLHIDLNSALPTEESLKFFFEKILPGGIILFNDYGWRSFGDTKRSVDSFFQTKNVELLHLPTGQAIVFKK